MKKIIMLCFTFFAIANVMAQNKTVTGRVTDEKGEGIPQTSVVVKGSKTGTTTDETGYFKITVPESTRTLVISSIGYAEKQVAVSDVPLQIILATSISNIEEVVVVGYGTQKITNISGAISTVKSADIEKLRPVRTEAVSYTHLRAHETRHDLVCR